MACLLVRKSSGAAPVPPSAPSTVIKSGKQLCYHFLTNSKFFGYSNVQFKSNGFSFDAVLSVCMNCVKSQHHEKQVAQW
jgi:hypothetical protein